MELDIAYNGEEEMTLRELLNYIEFDAELDENKEIKLVDLQGVYLGDIGECRYEPTKDSVRVIIERCEIYWNDYVIEPLEEDIDCESNLTWNELYTEAVKYYGSEEETDKCTILKYLVNPELVELDKELCC